MVYIKGIIYDCGKIMTDFSLLKACEALATYSGKYESAEEIRNALFAGDHAPAQAHAVGSLTPWDFFLTVRETVRLDTRLPFTEFRDIWEDIFEENKEMHHVLQAVHPAVERCICSNTDPIHWRAIEQLPVMAKYFAHPHMLVLSYKMKTRKPNVRMYHEALRRLGLTEKEAYHALYVEDIAEYRDAFTSLGGNVIAYDCSKDPISVLENGLREFGVLRT